MAIARVLGLLALTCAACGTPDPVDAGAQPDGSMNAHDAGSPDASLDASSPDASLDAAAPDAALDASSPDASLDAAVPDAALDASLDAGVGRPGGGGL